MSRKNPIPLTDRRTFVYRAFGVHGELIYVGISQRWERRLEDHRKWSRWWKYVQHIEIQEFADRAGAFAMESWAISHEVPLGNTDLQEKHCPPTPPTPITSFGRWENRYRGFDDDPVSAVEVNLEDSEYQTGILAFG